jgi:hypothetical protein
MAIGDSIQRYHSSRFPHEFDPYKAKGPFTPYEKELRSLNITKEEAETLDNLLDLVQEEGPPVSFKSLNKRSRRRPSSTVKELSSLIRRGLVQRTREGYIPSERGVDYLWELEAREGDAPLLGEGALEHIYPGITRSYPYERLEPERESEGEEGRVLKLPDSDAASQ